MRRAGMVALVALTAACGSRRIGVPVEWPDPPEKPRIRFETAFSNTSDLDQSGWARFKRGVFGGSSDPPLMQPTGLAISDDGRRLYIADFLAGRVMLADFSARRLRVFAPDQPIGRPFAVALDGDERVYVTDSAGHRVVCDDRDGRRLLAFGEKLLERPTGIAVDREHGLVYVADTAHVKSQSHRVRVFDTKGEFLRDLGDKPGRPTRGTEDGQWNFPVHVAVGAGGKVYVADTLNFRIQVFDHEGKFVTKYGEHGDGPGTFSRIKGLAFDGFGNLYVVDAGHGVVHLYNTAFQQLMWFGGFAPRLEYFDVPSGIAIDRATNRIYVANQVTPRINVYQLINTSAVDSQPAPSAPPKSAGD